MSRSPFAADPAGSRLSSGGAILLACVAVAAAARAATVADRLEQYGAEARRRLRPHFTGQGLSYPPSRVTLVGVKSDALLHLYAAGAGSPARWVRSYPILAASGALGPKLREGDLQVPEGLYRIELLNPNSRFHLSLRLDYPNGFDRRMARADGRSRLGGDIMIHGNRVSIGCLAMGDPAAEELFVLAADTGLDRVRVILTPTDMRHTEPPQDASLPAWTPTLYREIRTALDELPEPPSDVVEPAGRAP